MLQLIENKEVVDVSNVDPEVLDSINKLAERRFALQVQLDKSNADFKAAQASAAADHSALITPIQAEIDEIDSQLVEKVEAHRSQLIGSKRKSFTTIVATFQFKKVAGKLKVVDDKGLMAAARKLGIVRKIARQVLVWKLDQAKFAAWLAKNGEYRMKLGDFIEGPSEGESLSLKPNGTYTVVHDDKRISPPSITIKKS